MVKSIIMVQLTGGGREIGGLGVILVISTG